MLLCAVTVTYSAPGGFTYSAPGGVTYSAPGVCSTMTPKQQQTVFWYNLGNEPQTLPCVDCGLMTGNFCDGGPALNYEDRCYANQRDPHGYPFPMSTRRTPLCTYCETSLNYCRYCRGVSSCTPPPTQVHWSGTRNAMARKSEEASAVVPAPGGSRQTQATTDQTTQTDDELRGSDSSITHLG